ncbi:MAG TPA: SDR family oxidoreductase [Verrucomicrobiae bacterium]|nr:SDR family oxidoreductase [Verrucomicrobiae bacterium]
MLTLITGGSRGIGYAIAQEMAKKGSDLLLVSQNAKKLQTASNKLKKQYPKLKINSHVCDMGSQEEINILADDCIRTNLVPDFLILNAGIFLEGSLVNSKPQDYRKTLEVNLNAIYYLVQRLAPKMASKKKPRIVLIASTAAYEAYPVGALYGVAKWALRGYAVNLRKELMKNGIGVTLVAPGGTLTDLWAGEELPPNRLLEPKDIGTIIANFVDLSSQAVVEEVIVRPMLGDMHE